jgi:uncharacterized protein YjiS (DUF1127 family)
MLDLTESPSAKLLEPNIRSLIENAVPVHGRPTLMRLVSPIVRRLIEWRARVMQRRTLAMLDDHMLKDIGLSRMDVEREVSKPFWR